jgi:hypothetical protein
MVGCNIGFQHLFSCGPCRQNLFPVGKELPVTHGFIIYGIKARKKRCIRRGNIIYLSFLTPFLEKRKPGTVRGNVGMLGN